MSARPLPVVFAGPTGNTHTHVYRAVEDAATGSDGACSVKIVALCCRDADDHLGTKL
ncbi:MAG: hypothetical protein H0X25_16315 [Acidobacteriales bacterium]|nr:hypothetical protein [Terriglobales bacterium]